MYTLLIADDEALERDALKLFASRSGIPFDAVIECRNGTETVRRALLEHPDIIVLDINMPGLNGLEALEKIRVSCPRARVIVSTAFSYFEYARKALQLGVVEFLVKPVSEPTIVATLRAAADALENERGRDEANTRRDAFMKFVGSRLVWDLACGECSDEVAYYLDGLRASGGLYGFAFSLRFASEPTIVATLRAAADALENERGRDEANTCLLYTSEAETVQSHVQHTSI